MFLIEGSGHHLDFLSCHPPKTAKPILHATLPRPTLYQESRQERIFPQSYVLIIDEEF